MAAIRDVAITIEAAAVASMVCEMPEHVTGDLLVAFVNKDTASNFTTPSGWDLHRAQTSAGSGGGVYAKRAASGSETVTFALTSETCIAVVLSIKNVEAVVDSGAGALTINVVAAGLTFTRTTGSFTTDGFSVGQSVVMSGFTNAGNNGVKTIVSITGSGTILTVTSEATLVNESGNNNERVISTGVDRSAKRTSDDSTLPLTGIGVTPVANDCLILHGLSTDSGFGPSAYPGWVNLFTGDAAANSLCVSYTRQVTAGAITAPDHWGALADDARAFVVAIRDDGNGTEVDPYIAPGTTPCTLVSPLVFATTADRGTWELTTNDITSVGGKTMNQVDAVAAADSGFNPFRAATRVIAASSKTLLTGSEMRFTAAEDMTAGAGVLFGTWRFQLPRDYLDCSKPVFGGVLLGIADAENDHSFWTVGGQFSKTTDPSNRQNYAIEVGTTDTVYATSGTLGLSAINDLYLAGSGYYGACSVEWSDLYLLNEVVLAGGTAGVPLNFLDLEQAINDGSGRIPLFVRVGSAATVWSAIRFGGVDPIHLGINLRTFQFPRKADEVDYLDFHVSNNKMGIEFYGLSGDTLGFTGCVFTSDSPYYWRFNSSHSSGADLDFTGSVVVNATVTLRSTVSLAGASFVDCPTFTQNNADLDECTFINTKVDCDNPADLADCSFTSGGTGHAIEISATGTFSFVGNSFGGYGADGTTDAAVYNNSGGAVTLNVSGGGTTPTVRNGAGASTTVNANVSITVTPLVAGSEVRAYRVSDGVELAGTESSSGSAHVLSLPAATAVHVVVLCYSPPKIPVRIENVSFSVDQNLNPFQRAEPNFSNP